MVYTFNVISDLFHITNGNQQGFPLSPIISTMIMELLAETIRSNPLISGIKVANQSYKVGLFANNVILTLTRPDVSLPAVQRKLSRFSAISYYKLNMTKSWVLPIAITRLTCNPNFPVRGNYIPYPI